MRTWWERMISGRLLLGVGVARRRWCCWLLHLEAGTVPRQLSDAVIGWRWWCGRWHCSSCWTGTFAHLDLSHDSSVMNVQHHNRSIRSAQINLRRKRQKSASVFCLTSRSCTSVCIMTCLLIVRCPSSSCDGWFLAQHGGPIALPSHWTHQNEPVLHLKLKFNRFKTSI